MLTRRSLIRAGALSAPALILPSAAKAMQLALPWYNPLAYPAGATPSISPSNPLGLPAFAGVCTGGNFTDIVSGKTGVIGGAPTSSIDGVIGPSLSFVGSTDAVNFAATINGGPSNWYQQTFAAIFRPISSASTNAILICSGFYIYLQGAQAGASGFSIAQSSDGTAISGFTPLADVPYLGIGSMSVNDNTFNFVLKRLDTGKTYASAITYTMSTTHVTGVSISIGSRGSSLPAQARVSHAAWWPSFASLSAMKNLSDAPWSTWYQNGFTLMAELNGALATSNNRTLLGVGR
jgi:hypothetical protein